eukprot:1437812-Pyramimonas_sp.AAC.1
MFVSNAPYLWGSRPAPPPRMLGAAKSWGRPSVTDVTRSPRKKLSPWRCRVTADGPSHPFF